MAEPPPVPVELSIKDVKSMSYTSLVKYSLSSPAAIKIVKEARVPIQRMSLDSSGPCLFLRLGFGRESLLQILGTDVFVEGKMSIGHLVSGDVVEICKEVIARKFMANEEEKKKRIIGLVLNHFTTLFPFSSRGRFIVNGGQCLDLMEEFLSPDNVRTVPELSLSGRWTLEQMERVLDCFMVSNHIQFSSMAGLTVERVLGLTVPSVRFTGGVDVIFKFFVRKWTAGEAFHDLEKFQYTSKDEMFGEEKKYLEDIEWKPWDPERRPRFYCTFGNGEVPTCDDLSDGVDVTRWDGRIGTIYYNKEYGKVVVFQVWKEEELVRNDKELMGRALEEREKEYEEMGKSEKWCCHLCTQWQVDTIRRNLDKLSI